MLLLPLLSLSALWGFVLNLTIGDGISLLRANTIYQSLGVTSTDLGLKIQAERSLSVAVLSTGTGDPAALATQRAATDTSLGKFRASAESGDTLSALNEPMKTSLTGLLNEIEQLPGIRANVDTRQAGRLETAQAYTRVMDALFRLYDRMVSVPDLSIYEQAGAMQAMGNAREIISRQNALVSGALTSQGLSDAEYTAFAEWAANRRFQYSKGMAMLDPELRRPYEEVFASPTFRRFAAMEQDLISNARLSGPLPDSLGRWKAITDNLSATLDQVGAKDSSLLADRARTVATGILVRIGLAGGLGLVAVVASIVISVRFGRRLIRELAGLRNSARELADVRLPHVVDRLRKGEPVDVAAEAPEITAGESTEIEDVARAFGSVQHTAVQAAVEQADLRRGVSQVFLNLARRKQGLLHRQLTLLDAMQRRAAEPEALEDLFHLDHLTTRMRRHAESLIILSGSAPGRVWRKPVPAVDIIRAAVAEVEGYTRVNVLPVPNAYLSGAAVADLIHLIAELVENATVFSPPQTRVLVRGESVANGFVVEIEDRGLGLLPEEYEAVNDRLAHPPEFDLADSDRLGLFVVSQLAARNGVSVLLRGSPYGGTTAIVLIPKALVVDDGSPSPIPGSLADDVPHRPRGSLARVALQQGGGGHEHPPVPPEEDDDDPRFTTSPFFTPTNPRGDAPSLTVVPAIPHSDDPPGTDVPDAAGSASDDGGPAATAPPRPAGAVPSPRGPLTGGTHNGLPRRVRQANMAPQLRETTGPLAAPTPPYPGEPGAPEAGMAPAGPATGPAGPTTGSGRPERSPDEARAMFSAFQQGSRRGREDSGPEDGDPPGDPEGARDSSKETRDPSEGRLSRSRGEHDPSGGGEDGDVRPDEDDQQPDLRDHSEGYVHLTTGEKGDE
ncbi:nitrate- and nitrite sensing domain-containing protein [Sphaerisporangium sp. TRM90804]|uniref:nitrate- and nitrite sensing domain-containing protein n=1 Tax=Sphaerisporangium sp. TRM90804 TaxID=3031113 RepID=UPI00244B1832|nr:nitrate- and nitrite sensing domain-containing protein [Sphaerisporangium sp. TRM90804]MDH2426602.1 nitrate- and nitrite sensing domain-containing protein [Sphaerisporangium sp. TRM90804]